MNPEISVVMPCYRSRETIPRALASVQAQTMPDWEMVAVDDGSPDGDSALLDALARTEPRLRVLRQENGGVSAARNAGMEAAQGRWVFFLDADDRLPADAFRSLLALDDGRAEILCGAYEMRFDGGESSIYTCRDGGLAVIQESLIRGDSALNSMCARLYRREMLRRTGILAPAGVRVGEDVLFNLEAFAAARGWRMTDRIVYYYEYGGDSAMTRARRDIYRESLPLLRGIGAFLRRENLQTERFRAHIDAWLRTLRADRGRLRAALAFDRAVVHAVTDGVEAGRLRGKERLYYHALRFCPFSSILLP